MAVVQHVSEGHQRCLRGGNTRTFLHVLLFAAFSATSTTATVGLEGEVTRGYDGPRPQVLVERRDLRVGTSKKGSGGTQDMSRVR